MATSSRPVGLRLPAPTVSALVFKIDAAIRGSIPWFRPSGALAGGLAAVA